MAKKRWFRFHIDDFLNGVRDLSPNEITALIIVIVELYDKEGFLEPNYKALSRRCNMRPSSFHKAIETLVRKGKLNVEAGFLTNKRVTQEIREREKLARHGQEYRKNKAQVARDPTPASSQRVPGTAFKPVDSSGVINLSNRKSRRL